MKKRIIYSICFCQLCTISLFSQSYHYPVKILKDTLYSDIYSKSSSEKVFVGDMKIIENILNAKKFGNTFHNEKRNFNYRITILELGYGQLLDTTKAKKAELDAQKRAFKAGVGMWKSQIPTPPNQLIPQQPDIPKSWLSTFWQFIKDKYEFIFGTLISLGVFAWLFKKIYTKFWIEKQLRLLILGEQSSGKTAMFKSLLNPNTTKDDIFRLSTSKVSVNKKTDKIPHGKYEIILELQDVPGSEYGEIWDNIYGTIWDHIFGHRNHAIIFLLAPFKDNCAENINGHFEMKKVSLQNAIDRDYLSEQFGLLKAYVGALSSKNMSKRRKPKIVILFINKFDAFSSVNPKDSSSKDVADKIREQFSKHILYVEKSAKTIGFECKIVLGSTVEKFGVSETLDNIKNILY